LLRGCLFSVKWNTVLLSVYYNLVSRLRGTKEIGVLREES